MCWIFKFVAYFVFDFLKWIFRKENRKLGFKYFRKGMDLMRLFSNPSAFCAALAAKRMMEVFGDETCLHQITKNKGSLEGLFLTQDVKKKCVEASKREATFNYDLATGAANLNYKLKF